MPEPPLLAGAAKVTVACASPAVAGPMVGAPGSTAAIVTLYAWLALYGPVPVELSVAVTVKLKVPAAVGVPESRPLGASGTPVGVAPEVTANVYGGVPPDAVMLWEYAMPKAPAGSVAGAGVITGGSMVIDIAVEP